MAILELDALYPAGADLERDQAVAAADALLHLAPPADRREATRFDPLLFGVLYFGHHLSTHDGPITLSDFHLELCQYAAAAWTTDAGLRQHRNIFAAPRDSGKSTWLYLILPVWAAAHGWSTFAATFADSAHQAETHLGTMRLEFETNDILRLDFPDLVAPLHGRSGRTVSDRIDQLHQANGFRIVARGIDRSTLGLKIGSVRPDLLLLDDLEPDEARYSETLARKRRRTLIEAVLPMNLRARVLLTGTVVMYGSIVHQAIRSAAGELGPDELADASWVGEEGFVVHVVDPIITDPDGRRRSFWPHRFPLADLEAMEGTRAYAKNYLNRPLPGDGDYWRDGIYRYGNLEDGYGATILYIDPAVTTRSSSDYTGIAVVSRSPAGDDNPALWVRYTTRVRLVGERLRNRIEAVLAEHQDIRRIVVETNQGGDYVLEALAELGPPVVGDTAKVSKEVRAERVLDYYERGKVFHVGPQPLLEAEQTGFPEADTRDVLDAVNGAALYLVTRRRKRDATASRSYL